jgi:hypothetical protein
MTPFEKLRGFVERDRMQSSYTKEQIIELIDLIYLDLEKQQIIEAHGDKLKKSSGVTNYEYWFSGEDYYNKKFNK